jgi:hypothetical protein
MWRGVLGLVGLTSACGGQVIEGDPRFRDAAPHVDAQKDVQPINPACADAGTPPGTLECTGLYANISTKQVAAGVREYAPAVQLWSDGADKRRWIQIPPGMKIDASDPNEWKFPVGTKVWKEFSVAGKRVETRLWQKREERFWIPTTYAWNAGESQATLTKGGDVQGPAGLYHIPLQDECEDCHRGRTDRILGFEQVSLGLEGATGLVLEQLVAENLIEPAPARTKLEVGDDGTGLAVEPLKWLHANCGTTCHNGNSNAKAYGAKMRLRLDPELLDGRSPAQFDSLLTTLNVTVNSPNWFGQTRVTPGIPEASLLVTLISNRRSDNPAANQMPPIASRVVDRAAVDMVVQWIRSMPRAPGNDASVPDSGVVDSGLDVSTPDTGVDVSEPPDSGVDAPDGGADGSVDSAGSTDGTSVTDAGATSAGDAGGA